MNLIEVAKKLNNLPTKEELLSTPLVKDLFVKYRTQIVGAEEADLSYSRNVMNFTNAISSDAKLAKCTNFSLANAFLDLSQSGVDLFEGEAHLIPYNDKANLQIGYAGRMKQLYLNGAVDISVPQVVYDGDDFETALDENGCMKVVKHNMKLETTKIILSYMYVTMKDDSVHLIYKTGQEIEASKVMSKVYQRHVKNTETMTPSMISEISTSNLPYQVAFPREHACNILYGAALKRLKRTAIMSDSEDYEGAIIDIIPDTEQ